MAKVSSGAIPSHASSLVDCSRWWKGNCDVGLAQLYLGSLGAVCHPSNCEGRYWNHHIAAQTQVDNQADPDLGHLGDMNTMETLCPSQLPYSDGVERLGGESARERVCWVSAVWLVSFFRSSLHTEYSKV